MDGDKMTDQPRYFRVGNGTAVEIRDWNTDYPTQTIVNWTRPENVTDEQIDKLLYKLDNYAIADSNKMWDKYHVTLIGLPTDNPDKLEAMRTIVREWLAQL